MKTVLVLLNGIQLPYRVIDYATEWAKNNAAEINVVFLLSSKEDSTGYVFPSDLPIAETETDKEDALKDDRDIIENNVKIVREMIEMKDIPYKSEIKLDAGFDEVIALTKEAALLVVDADFDDEGLPLNDEEITLKNLRQKARCPVQVVS